MRLGARRRCQSRLDVARHPPMLETEPRRHLRARVAETAPRRAAWMLAPMLEHAGWGRTLVSGDDDQQQDTVRRPACLSWANELSGRATAASTSRNAASVRSICCWTIAFSNAKSGFAVSLVYRGEHGIDKVSLARRALPTRASSVHVGRAQPVAFGGLVRRDLGTANRLAKLDVAWPLLDRRR